MAKKAIPVISLFTGEMGLDLGLEAAGFRIAVAVECDKVAAQTIRQNRPNVALFEDRLENVSTEKLLKAGSIAPCDDVLVIGGPSCQAFSTAGHRRSLDDPRGGMFREVHPCRSRDRRKILCSGERQRVNVRRGDTQTAERTRSWVPSS